MESGQYAGADCAVTAPTPELTNRILRGGGVPQQEKRPIVTQIGLRGYRVDIGCQWVAFETREKLIQELERYLNDPQSVEKEYLERKS